MLLFIAALGGCFSLLKNYENYIHLYVTSSLALCLLSQRQMITFDCDAFCGLQTSISFTHFVQPVPLQVKAIYENSKTQGKE